MDSFIVHILRRHPASTNEAAQLDGVVEVVSDNEIRHAFHSLEELWAILSGFEGPSSDGLGMPENSEE